MTTPEHSHAEPAAPVPLTASATLRLATPAALSEGLRLLGLIWEPAPWDASVSDDAPGMYAWVIPIGLGDLRHSPAIYLGVGTSSGGWHGRVHDEESWRTGDHGHGIAIRRTRAKSVGGPVRVTTQDLAWLSGVVTADGAELLRAYLRDVAEVAPPQAAEAIAIRMAIHLGDTGLPVNSTHGGAWNNNSGQDWAGYAAARRMRLSRGEELD